MILNLFISAIIATFFLGNASREKIEKTKKASLFRSCVYFFLTIVAFVIFYKSYQVSTIVNMVDIKSLRGAEDSLNNSRDTINIIRIYNKFREMGTYDNKTLTLANQHKKDSFYTKNGGVLVKIQPANSPKYPVKNRELLTQEMRQSIEGEFNRDISTTGPSYTLTFLSTNIPSYVPFYPDIEYGSPWEHKDGYMLANTVINSRGADNIYFTVLGKENKGAIKDLEGGKEIFENGIVVQQTIVVDYLKEKLDGLFMSISHDYANAINILTAADLSQYTYVLTFNSELYIKEADIEYNIPIEVSGNLDGVSGGSHNIHLNEQFIKTNRGQTIMFHVTLPSMANIQLIRSLILTALLTTLFSLFCRNVYYYLANLAYEFHRKNRMRFSSPKRQKLFQKYNYTVTFIFIAVIFYIMYYVVFGKAFLVYFDTIWYWVIGIVLFTIIVLSVATYYIYKYAVTPETKKRGKEKIKEREAKEKEAKEKEAKTQEKKK